MKKFAQLLHHLYFTYSHLNKMDLLLHFFSSTPDPDRGYALAIMADTPVFPRFNRALIKELIQDRIDPVLFALSQDYVGDVSETLALLWPSSMDNHELPLLSFLISKFNSLPKTEIKSYLSDLLDKSNAIERWAILKLGMGNLRIGISARFLKNTLAKYGHVEVQEIEKIWHALNPPYMELFNWLEKKSPIPLNKDSIFFHPVMLSHPFDEKDLEKLNLQEFLFERKYDGIRVQIVSTIPGKALFTRTGDNISGSFPDLLNSIEGNVVLDGELLIKTVNGIGSFNDLQQRLNRKAPSKKLLSDLPAAVMLYDILSWNSNDLRALPFIKRREKLEQWVAKHPSENILLSDLLPFEEGSTLPHLKQQILQENQPSVEGLMLKNKRSPYLAGRPKGHWYKWKRDPLIVDAVLMYAQHGHGKRSSYYSDYTFGLWRENQLLPIGKAYFGFTDIELKKLDHWIRHNMVQHFGPILEVKKELVLEIAFDAVSLSSRHKSGVALRFPRINRIRWDKPAEEADQLTYLLTLIK